MKTLATAGLLAAVILAGALLFRHHAKVSQDRDAALQVRLAGVWLRAEDNLPRGTFMPLSLRCTNTVAADGSFVCQSCFLHSDRTNTYRDAGTWRVQDGNLTETVTNDSNPSAVTPRSSSGRIDFAQANEFVIYWHGNTNTQTWRRISS